MRRAGIIPLRDPVTVVPLLIDLRTSGYNIFSSLHSSAVHSVDIKKLAAFWKWNKQESNQQHT